MREIALHEYLLDESATFVKREIHCASGVFHATAKPQRENGLVSICGVRAANSTRFIYGKRPDFWSGRLPFDYSV